jgi:hypothetical protein
LCAELTTAAVGGEGVILENVLTLGLDELRG